LQLWLSKRGFELKLEGLKLKNFKTFRDVQIQNLPDLCVFVGANGSGKSTVFSVFEFLREALTTNVTVALSKLGGSRGFQEVRSRNATGPIEIEVKFTEGPKKPLVTYSLTIDEIQGRAVVTKELLKYRRGSGGKPWHFLDFENGKGEAVTNEIEFSNDVKNLEREHQTLKSPDILAIKGLAQFERFPAAVALGNLIENWHISDLHISKVRQEKEFSYAEHLSREGDNLSLVLQYLHKNHFDVFQTILAQLKRRIPGITSVESKTTEEGKVLLKFQDGSFEDPFLARFVSDGTIKMLAYLILLYDPNPSPLLCVEEPENQLYPKLLAELAEEFRMYAKRGSQVMVSSHSPDFLNAVNIEEVFWLSKKNGATEILRASDNKQIKTYVKMGDPLGALWDQGFFEGADPI
jgi:predicted ATPase